MKAFVDIELSEEEFISLGGRVLPVLQNFPGGNRESLQASFVNRSGKREQRFLLSVPTDAKIAFAGFTPSSAVEKDFLTILNGC